MVESARVALIAPDRLRLTLRAATDAQHQGLHAHPLLARLADGTITQAQNTQAIARMAAFYRSADPVLAAACARFRTGLGGYRYYPRAHRLDPDRPANRTGAQDPVGTPGVPDPAGLPELAGALYVVDGALIGGRVLARSAHQAGLTAGRAHWDWCARQGPAIWRTTLALLERIGSGPDTMDRACASAHAWFAAFGRSMDAQAHHRTAAPA